MKDLDFAGIARLVEHGHGPPLARIVKDTAPVADGLMIFDAPGSPINKVCGIGFDRVVTDEDIDTIIAFFKQRGVEPKVELSAFAPPELLAGLARKGFVLRELENTLVREIPSSGELRTLVPGGWPEGVTIERVNPADVAAVHEYARVAFGGFLPEGME